MVNPRIKSILKGLLVAIILIPALAVTLAVGFFVYGYLLEDSLDLPSEYMDETQGETADAEDNCHVLGIELHGEVTTYDRPVTDYDTYTDKDFSSADRIIQALNEINSDDTIKAIVLEVDSYGGSGVAGEEIANALKDSKKPTVALVRNGATSAAYLAVTGANFIVASAMSDVGSIGVTQSYLDYTKQNLKDGITYIELNSGKFKNTGDPDKPLSAEERVLLQRDIDIMHRYFVEQVAANRRLDVDKVSRLADGSSMMGQMALENGLIDKVGGMDEVKQYFIDKGLMTDKESVCWY